MQYKQEAYRASGDTAHMRRDGKEGAVAAAAKNRAADTLRYAFHPITGDTTILEVNGEIMKFRSKWRTGGSKCLQIYFSLL